MSKIFPAIALDPLLLISALDATPALVNVNVSVSNNRACRMIGNAFPPPVAQAVGEKIKECLEYECVDSECEISFSLLSMHSNTPNVHIAQNRLFSICYYFQAAISTTAQDGDFAGRKNKGVFGI